ncbi:MAG TPA: glutamate--tRNA ligase [Chitinophagales bacterium]|nr:glutamate--tRNA ligase [Chitinophagales bacterium]
MDNSPVRVRFAPSPTGPLHIGGVRTALYNYFFAKKNKGSFIIRIEDTDQNRAVSGAEEYILESLNWCGIMNDEGPNAGGSYAPYRQSERKEIYLAYAEMLLQKDHAYYAFDTPEELEAMRERLKEEKNSSQQYDSATRMSMKNSLTLSAAEVKTKIDHGDHYVIRTKIPANETVVFNDLIRGEVTVDSNQLDDKVLFKSDGWPTYHLANTVDDYLMKITHVIRGEEWLPSAPLHVLLYKFFGWEEVMPQFAHLPLLLRPDGNGKLSKRDGDRLGFPVFALNWKDPSSGEESKGFRERGFFPEPLVNFLALLGWHPSGDKEVMTIEEMIHEFSIEHIHKAGARFDFEKAKWFNHEFMKKMSGAQLAEYFIPVLQEKNVMVSTSASLSVNPAEQSASKDYVAKVCDVLKGRCSFISEFWENGSFFFQQPTSFDELVVKSKWNEKAKTNFGLLIDEMKSFSDFSTTSVDEFLHSFLQKNNLKAGDLLPILRVALIGTKNGPAVFEIISLLGKEETATRMTNAISTFEKMTSVS